MKEMLISKVLLWVGKKLDGVKMYIGGVAILLYGVIAVVGKIWPDLGLPDMDSTTMKGLFDTGLGMLGIGAAHKMQKNTTAIIDQTEVLKSGQINVPGSPEKN